jgi:hypothetical protein
LFDHRTFFATRKKDPHPWAFDLQFGAVTHGLHDDGPGPVQIQTVAGVQNRVAGCGCGREPDGASGHSKRREHPLPGVEAQHFAAPERERAWIHHGSPAEQTDNPVERGQQGSGDHAAIVA